MEPSEAQRKAEPRFAMTVERAAYLLAALTLASLLLRRWVGPVAATTVGIGLAIGALFLAVGLVVPRFLPARTGGLALVFGMLVLVLGIAASSEGLWTPILFVLPVLPSLSTRLVHDRGPSLVLVLSLAGIGGLLFFPDPGSDLPHPPSARALLLAVAVLLGAVFAHRDEQRRDDRQRRLDATETRYRLLFERIADPVIVTSADGRILSLNDAAVEALDFSGRAEALATPVSSLYLATEDRGSVLRELAERGYLKERFSRLRTPGGREIVIAGTTMAEKGRDGELATLMTIFRDVTREHQLQEELQEEARRDHLTGLLNRRGFEEKLAETLGRVERYDEQAAVLLLDLDGFKEINDRHGHPAGDAALRQVSRRLARVVRSVDTLARLGGDEFAVINTHATDDGVRALAERLVDAVRTPLRHDGTDLRLDTCVGAAFCIRDGDAGSVVERADRLLYAAKARGKGEIATEDAPAAPSTG